MKKKLFKYFTVAIISFVIDISIFIFLNKLLNFNIYIATILAFYSSFLANFFLSRNYIFKKKESFKSEFIQIKLIALIALLLNIFFVYLLAMFINNTILVRLCTIALVFFFNFISRYYFYRPNKSSK
jgi:putative flippase GtrA